MAATRVVLGMDMGGTNLRLAVVGADGKVHRAINRPLGRDKAPRPVIEEIGGGLDELRAWCHGREFVPVAVSLGAPGIIAREEGTIVFSPNLPGWRDVPLRRIIGERTGLPTGLENDANAAAFGEYWQGGGRGTRHLVMFTLGTGVGGGIISDGRLVRGSRGMAGELGHLTVAPRDGLLCNCGNRGCLEAYASATAIVARLAENWKGDGPSPPTARDAYLLAREGDEECLAIFREAGTYLGTAMANLVNTLNPEVFIIGGGAAEAWEMIVPAAEEEMRSRAIRFTDLASRVALRKAELGDLAGVIGAAGIIWSEGCP